MTKLSEHQAGDFTKLLYIGDSGSGKTGSLASLVAAGYKLRILDLDNGLDVLRQFIMHECSDKIDNVDFETVRDKYKATRQGPMVAGTAKAYVKCIELMTTWSDETIPAEWGSDTIFILDSLTTLGSSAYEWAKSMDPTAKDKRQWYFAAQQSIENMLALLTSESFQANVIVISHINYNEITEGVTKGYPSAVGSALGPKIAKYFNTLLQAETRGAGKNIKRVIRTVPSPIIDLKTPAPFKIKENYPLGTGLAELFTQLKST